MLPVSSKLGFGVGQIAEGVTAVAFGSFLLFFYNQVIGISASLTGLALAIALAFDAVSDPLSGSISDRLVTRWGRRHPLIAGSAIPLALCVIGLFNPPADMPDLFYFGWLVVFAVLARLCLTLYHIPHMALGAEMAQDVADRTRVFSYSQLFGTLGAASFSFAMLTLFFATTEGSSHGMLNADGYPRFAMVAACAIVISIGLCVWGTRREIPYLPGWDVEHEPLSVRRLWRDVITALGSRSYRMLLCGLLGCQVILGVEQTFMVYIYVHFWALDTEAMRWLGPMGLLALPLSVMMAPYLTRVLDKRTVLLVFGSFIILNVNILIILRLFTDVLPQNGDPALLYVLLGLAFFNGLITPALSITFNSMFADVADELDFRTSGRQEGIIFSARSFGYKASAALATVIGGIALDLIGFPRGAEFGEVPSEIIFRLGLVAGPATIVLGMLNLMFFFGYRLDRKRMAVIQTELTRRRASTASPQPAAQVADG
jgi:GPH family glycoside/pentoside/hexuronide:cation symporter